MRIIMISWYITSKVPQVYKIKCVNFIFITFYLGIMLSLLNFYVGEVKIRAFMSFMQNQVEWEQKMDRYREAQIILGFLIRDDYLVTCVFRGNYKLVAQLGNVALIYERSLNQTIRDFWDVQGSLPY